MIYIISKPNIEFNKYLKNTSWLLAEKLLRLFLAFFINIWLARYLGPENFGFLAYGLSFMLILKTLTHLGLDGLTTREIINGNPEKEEKILKTVFFMKFIASLISVTLFIIIIFNTEEYFSSQFWLLITLSFVLFFSPFETINFWFNAKVLGKFSSLSFSFSIIVSSLVKVVLILLGSSLLWFGVPIIIEFLVLTLCFLYFYNKKNIINFKINFTNIDFNYIKELFSQSWKIMFGAIFAIIYLKVDQVMLETMKDSSEVGIYAVAAQLSEVWYFIPTIIVTSIFPKIIEFKKTNKDIYKTKLQQLFNFLFLLALIISIIVNFIAEDLISFLYGNEYILSAQILIIHIWASIFIFMRALFSKWILIENVLMFSLLTQGFGAFSNILLNYFLIPDYGAYGAAIATLISYGIASYIALIFYSKTREVFWMMSKSFFSPITLPYYLIKEKNVR